MMLCADGKASHEDVRRPTTPLPILPDHGDVGAIGPHLCALLAIPPPSQHVVAGREVRGQEHDVNDAPISAICALLLGECPVSSLGGFVYSGSFWVAERIQLEIWTEIDTLHASNGYNLPLLRAYTLNPKVLHPKRYALNPKTVQGSH